MLVGSILMILGAFCLVYFVMYGVYVDFNNTFVFFWLVGAVVLTALGIYIWKRYAGGDPFPKPITILGGMFFAVLFIGSGVLMYGMIQDGNQEGMPNADYIIILGARVRGTQMSNNLLTRVETASKYLEQNPTTKVITSGGQGKGEDISEGRAMAQYLVQHGIPRNRIIIEETSKNSDENIKNSLGIISEREGGNLSDRSIVVVSNDFHMFRATRLIRKQSGSLVKGLPSKTIWYTIPNNYVREMFAIVKYLFEGKISW